MTIRQPVARWLTIVLLLALLPAIATGAPPGFVTAGGLNPGDRASDLPPASVDDRYVIEFSGSSAQAADAAAVAVRAAGGRVVHRFAAFGRVAAHLPPSALNALQRNPNIRSIEVDPRRYPLADTVVPGQETIPYGVTLTQADQISAASAGNRTVCIIDSGYGVEHEDLQDTNVTGVNDVGAGPWNVDRNGHGSHVAGTIAALDNGKGVRGVIANGALKLHIIKVFGDNGLWAYSSSLIAAVDRCEQAGANVVNMSLGSSSASTFEAQAFAAAYSRGVLLVAAAGNNGTTAHSYPASYDSVVSVGALDASKQIATFSQKNNQVELAAPGVNVLSTVPTVERIELRVNGATYPGLHVENAARTNGVTGQLVNGGYCATGNGAWSGRVVLCQRGSSDGSTISFATKVGNVQTSGGVAAVIYNDVPGNDYYFTLGYGNYSAIPAVSLSQANGQAALAQVGQGSMVLNGAIYPDSGYEAWNGTSMATPHVAGVAALVWSHNPAWTNAQVRASLQQTAEDLGAPGRDTSYGFGLVRAKAALDYLQSSFTLTVIKSGAGSGTVTSTPAGINCGATCATSFSAGSTITLTASPGTGSTFTGWSGACSGSGACVVTMTASRNVTATFRQAPVATMTPTHTPTSTPTNTPPPGATSTLTPTATATPTTVPPAIPPIPPPSPPAGLPTVWHFAEGYTGAGFDQYLTIQNPNAQAASIRVTYYRNGASPVVKTFSVPPNSRDTVIVHETARGVGRGWEVSATVESLNGVGIVVERPMYFTYGLQQGGMVAGGHNAMGVNAPRQTWLFAEGYTGAGFDEYLTIMNPNPTAAPVALTYYRNGAAPVVKHLTVPGSSRYTVVVHDTKEGVGRGQEVSAKVETSHAGGIVVERPMYFAYQGTWWGGHTTPGAASPRLTWHFPDGDTRAGQDQYLTIMNPSGTDAAVTLTYYLSGTPVLRQLTAPANRRTTVAAHGGSLGDASQSGIGRGQRPAVTVTSTNGVGIVVERPLYDVSGGDTVLGAAAAKRTWLFAEGYTGPSFRQELVILNPHAEAAGVTITYYLPGGETRVRTLAAPARSRRVVSVNGPGEGVGANQEVAAKVETSHAGGIVVERPIRFTYQGSIAGSHTVMGFAP